MAEMEGHIIGGDGLGFLDEVERQAGWRSQKAEEYPEDDRNEQAAAGLEGLAKWIRHHLDSPVVLALDLALDSLYETPDFAALRSRLRSGSTRPIGWRPGRGRLTSPRSSRPRSGRGRASIASST